MSLYRRLAFTFMTFAAATAVVADEPTVVKEEQFKFVLADGGDAEVFELEGDSLEVGESRQFFTDSGKEIVIVRTADGFDVTVDGEALDDIDESHTKIIHVSGQGDSHVTIDDEVHKMVFIKSDDSDEDGEHGEHGEHEMVWVSSGDAKAHAFTIGEGQNAVEHLQESGALDSLDEATKAKILAALSDLDGEKRVIKIHRVEKEDDEHN